VSAVLLLVGCLECADPDVSVVEHLTSVAAVYSDAAEARQVAERMLVGQVGWLGYVPREPVWTEPVDGIQQWNVGSDSVVVVIEWGNPR
jgi:cytochrome c551/c552